LKRRNGFDVGTKPLLNDANRTGFYYSCSRFNLSQTADVISPDRRQAFSEDTNEKQKISWRR